jgi:hypothetical protein
MRRLGLLALGAGLLALSGCGTAAAGPTTSATAAPAISSAPTADTSTPAPVTAPCFRMLGADNGTSHMRAETVATGPYANAACATEDASITGVYDAAGNLVSGPGQGVGLRITVVEPRTALDPQDTTLVGTVTLDGAPVSVYSDGNRVNIDYAWGYVGQLHGTAVINPQ